MPALVWLSSSSADINRARNILKALTPGGVIDELGFLILNGAFAERFYPAVTTPMTRARYFFFVPAIYQYIERSGKGVGHDVDKLARDLQYELLKMVETERGAIGKEGRRAIVRPPSEIYWGALAVLGFATQHTSLTTYQRRLSEGTFKAQMVRDDDKSLHPEETESLWDPTLRLSYMMRGDDREDGVFPTGTTLSLRRAESALLRDRFAALLTNGHRPLITHMVAAAQSHGLTDLGEFKLPWTIPLLPEHTANVVEHARRLSLFARGTTLQYYRLLVEKKGVEDVGASDAFATWWEAAVEDLRTWDTEAFFELIGKWGADRRPLYDRAFLGNWIARCVVANSGQQALGDPEARRIIADREKQVRRGKERLQVKYQLDSWQQPGGYRSGDLYQLEYRHSVGRQFAQDIVQGLSQETS